MGSGPIDLRRVIAGKSPKLAQAVPDFLVRAFARLLHLRNLNRGLRLLDGNLGLDFVSGALDFFGVQVDSSGADVLEGLTRPVVVANHPLGGLDGLAILQEVGRIHRDIVSPVNEFLLAIPQLRGIFIPVHKLGAGRTALLPLVEAYRGDKAIVHFPAGLCSRLRGGAIRDLAWQKSFVTLARRYGRPVVPAHVSGRNSLRFYTLAKIRAALGLRFNIEMLLLVDEMFSQEGSRLRIEFGAPVDLGSGSAEEVARRIRREVYRLGDAHRTGESARDGSAARAGRERPA